MSSFRIRTVALGAVGLLVVGLLTAPVAAAAAPVNRAAAGAQPAYTVIAQGLNNPRHLSFAGDGSLYVAESGTGGTGPCFIGGEGNNVCYGATGSITRLAKNRAGWKQQRVVTGLPSLAPPVDVPATDDAPAVAKGSNATGPSDIEVRGSNYVASIGLGSDPAIRGRDKVTDPATGSPATLPAGFGALIQGSVRDDRGCRPHRSTGKNRWKALADIAGHEARTNPIDTPDSNPASVLRAGSGYLVADAGGNTIVSADQRGRTRTVAAFPTVQVPFQTPGGTIQLPMQFVPTSVVVGPDHAYYVSQLTGFPFPAGGAAIWRVVPGHAPTQYATGLTNVTDLAFAKDGTLYAVEISEGGLAATGPVGALVRIPRHGGTPEPVVQGLFAPYGLALRGSDAYLTTGAVAAGGGQVIRIPLT